MSTSSLVANRSKAQAGAAGNKPAPPVPTAAGAGPSKEARRLAAVILEVLAGQRGPTQAAEVLAVSLMRYYQLEALALRGLVAGCEPRPRGRVASPATQVTALHKEVERLRRELARQQALVRLAQRVAGLPPPPAPAAGKPGKKQRRRRPTVRALRVAEQLRALDNEPDQPAVGPAASEADS